MIALIVGPDAALARAEVARLVEAHDPNGLNTSRLDGKTGSIDEAIGSISTPAFFGGGRVVVVDDLMARAARGSQGASERDDGDDAGSRQQGLDFGRLFAAVDGENLLILVDQALSSVPAAVKKAAPPEAAIFGGDPPRGAALVDWIQAKAREAGATIDGRTARLLAERSFPQTWANKPSNPAFDRPPDLDQLGNDIDKLAMTVYPNAIDAASVQMMIAGASEDRLFPFVEAVVTSNIAEAIPALESLQASGDDSGRIAAQIFQQVELAAVLVEAGGSTDPVGVGKAIGLSNPNRMIGVARTAKRGRLTPRAMVRVALDAERRSKRGGLRHPTDVVYHLLTAESAPVSGERERGDS